MRILVACEESQAVTIEPRKLGREAYSCDIVECSGGHPEWHIQGNALELINGSGDNFGQIYFVTQDNMSHLLPRKWDMIIAHPPCTYLSKAGARWMYPRSGEVNPERLKKAMEARRFFLEIFNADCPKIAIENPVPLKIVNLPKRTQAIQPYQFGHPYSKQTLLWLKGLPLLESTEVIGKYTPYCPSNTSAFAKGTAAGSTGSAHTAKIRAKTFPGIAKAMAEQWAGYAYDE